MISLWGTACAERSWKGDEQGTSGMQLHWCKVSAPGKVLGHRGHSRHAACMSWPVSEQTLSMPPPKVRASPNLMAENELRPAHPTCLQVPGHAQSGLCICSTRCGGGWGVPCERRVQARQQQAARGAVLSGAGCPGTVQDQPDCKPAVMSTGACPYVWLVRSTVCRHGCAPAEHAFCHTVNSQGR